MKFKKVWRWPKPLEDYIVSHCEGLTIHVACGSSRLGDIRIDRYSESPDVRADFHYLPIKSNLACTVVCDPPYGLDNQKRPRLTYELRRILKPGGKLLFKGWWFPAAPGLEFVSAFVDTGATYHGNVGLLFIMRKNKSDLWGER